MRDKSKILMIVSVITFLVIVAASLISAHPHIFADYSITGESVFVELRLENVSNLELRIPNDAKSLEVNNAHYILEDFKDFKMIKVTSAEDLRINYITEKFIDKSGDSYFFVMKNHFVEPVDIKISLPESAVLPESGIIFPKDFDLTTDGRRVTLSFDSFNEEQVLIKYNFIEEGNFLFYFLILVLVIVLILFYLNHKKIIKREVKKVKEKKILTVDNNLKEEEELTRNLFEDEKKIVKYLLSKKKGECWTKEIVNDLGISKVKLSRKLRSLEQKEIIKKIPYGNENIIRLLR